MADKMFFKDKQNKKRPTYGSDGFSTKRALKPGTAENPLQLTVTSAAREAEVAALVAEQGLHAEITVDEAGTEHIGELTCILDKPATVSVEKTPQRNDPCSCGSGKKFKKCCG